MTVSIKGGGALIANANTAVKLKPAPQTASVMTVIALPSNAGAVFIGDSSVATNAGLQLLPGQNKVYTNVDISLLYVVGANVGDGVSYSYEN